MVAKKPSETLKESPNRSKINGSSKIDGWFNAKQVLTSLLFKAIEEGNWGGARDIALSAPEEASKWVAKLESDGEIAWRRLPLHEVRNIDRGTDSCFFRGLLEHIRCKWVI
jgi:hypothetical protein